MIEMVLLEMGTFRQSSINTCNFASFVWACALNISIISPTRSKTGLLQARCNLKLEYNQHEQFLFIYLFFSGGGR